MGLSRITELAKADPRRKFFSIAHFLTPEALQEAFLMLRRDASAGVDRVTYVDYEEQAEQKIQELHGRLKNKTYRAQPLRRIYIPKEDGKKRPISIPALEDKIVQKAAVELLTAIYEQDFLNCSYGFRPGRGAQDALDEVDRVMWREPISCVLELDITSYFDSIVREQLMEMIERRISDASILRLIRKWINIGVIDDGRLLVSETGTGQIISPLLANIYLHFVLDEWFEREVRPRLRGNAFEIRYADDAVICLQYREDAEKVLQVLAKRFERFGLTLHPEKTRLVAFGHQTLARAIRMRTKTETFDFLGYVSSALMLCPGLILPPGLPEGAIERNIFCRVITASQCPQEAEDVQILAPRFCASRWRDVALSQSIRLHLQIDLRIDVRRVQRHVP